MENVRALPSAAKSSGGAKNFALTAVYFACGLLMAKGTMFGELAPFGASYAASVPKKRLAPALLGTAFGYIMFNSASSFRYIAVLIAVGGIRWVTSDLKRVRRSRLFAPLAAFVPVIATGIAMLFGSSSSLSLFSDCVTEAMLAAGGAYFMSITLNLTYSRRGIASYSQAETACLALTGCVLILSLGGIELEGISVGRIAAAAAIMLCARYGSAAGGAISGTTAGAVFSIAERRLGFVCGGYAFGGLMAGLFSSFGKLGSAAAFVVGDTLMSLAFGTTESIAPVFVEGVTGAVIFMLLPKELGDFITPLFHSKCLQAGGDLLRKNVAARLDFASRAISNVREDVKKVSEQLGALDEPGFQGVCENVAREVCAGCGLKMYCYEHEKGLTSDDFSRLEQPLKQSGRIVEKDVEQSFVKACCKKGEIAASMNKNYSELCSAIEARRRSAELRSAVAGQFSGLSDILSDLSEEFSSELKYDRHSAEKITAELSDEGLSVENCCCIEDKNGVMRVELIMKSLNSGLNSISKGNLARTISVCCGRKFDLPNLSEEEGKIRAALCELPVYDVEIGSCQHIAGNSKLCGDCMEYFNDGFGKTYAIICDGMGTGGRAAVDGNMAASVMGRLIRSGLSSDSSLKVVNSALMVKSSDETLSTVDLAEIDLYSGEITLKKAGAAATFVKKGSRVLRLEMPSLPAGILNGISFAADTIRLSSGDMIVMVSDGVMSGDEKWLEKLIKSWNSAGTHELAEAVVNEAIKRLDGSREDDITAMAIRLTDNG